MLYTQKMIMKKAYLYTFKYRIVIAVSIIIAASCLAADLGTFADYPDETTSHVTFADDTGKIDPTAKFIMDLAGTDHVKLLKEAMYYYKKNIRDYSAVLHKQERIRGELRPPQEIAIWFKEKPFSLVMKWLKNPTIVDKLLYVEDNDNDKRDDEMLVHPTGMFSWIKSVKKQPRCKEARENSLRTCDQFGFYRSMETLMGIYESASPESIKTKCLGRSKVYNRDCIAMVSAIPANRNFPEHVILMHFDTETLLPLGLSLYDANKQLQCKYFFSDLKINNGISDRFFTKKAQNM